MTATSHMTAEQLLVSPLARERVELVAGAIRPMTPTGAPHACISSNLLIALGRHVKDRALGALFPEQAGFLLRRSPDTVRCPDIAFVAAHRLPPGGVRQGYLDVAPDLAVEILSPSDRPPAVSSKVSEYLEAGVRGVWIVDPDSRTVTIFARDGRAEVRQESDVLDGGDVVPGFVCGVSSLFEGVARE
ncbi:MAG: Uma2 family endonuclease [Gemmatimonadaceae bacterium]